MIVSLRCDCAFFLEKLEIIMCRLWRPECVARHKEMEKRGLTLYDMQMTVLSWSEVKCLRIEL